MGVMKNILFPNPKITLSKGIKMKQTLKTLIRTVKSIKGNSLAEFATTTALMATLAATAAPKLSEMSEGAKAEKSRNELDKMIKQAGQFYQDTADIEGRGRFPGQDKYDVEVGGGDNNAILADLVGDWTNGELTTAPTYTDYTGGDGSDWVSVFGKDNEDFPAPNGAYEKLYDDESISAGCNTCPRNEDGSAKDTKGRVEWKALFGGEVVGSQYQDGHFVYQVVAGGGSGGDTYPPTLYVADIENSTHFNNVLEP